MRGQSKQWCYDVIVLSQPCYDLFDEGVLANNNMNMKKTANFWNWSVGLCINSSSFICYLEGHGHRSCVPKLRPRWWQSVLVWWTLDRVLVPLVIKAKVIKMALQWRSEWGAQAQSYVNQTELTGANWDYNAITSVSLNDTFVRRTTVLEKTANINWLHFSLSVTRSADAF